MNHPGRRPRRDRWDPVLDSKPYVAEMGPRTTVVEPEWIKELMTDYWQ